MPKLTNLLRGDSGEKPTEQILRKKALYRIAPDYAMLFFDHLYSEYLALKPFITEPATIELLEGLHQKRLKCELTWSDIYSFDLTLVQARPVENLIRKAYDARAKYRSIAGQKEYDEYVASKPPNLPEIHIDPDAHPPQPEVIIERALRADLEYLLSKVYLYYAILPVREGLRDWLTNRAVLITLGAVVFIGMLIFINVYLSLIGPANVTPDNGMKNFNEISVVFVTVLTVALAGIVGGCVSMLQRIQSAPSEGDALFNLAALTNGWKGIFLSPLYGGIFAALLFVLFAAGLLEGSAFPRINTPRRQWGPQASVTPSPIQSRSPLPSPSSTPSTSPSPTPSPNAAPTVSPTPDESANTQGLNTFAAGDTSANQASGQPQPQLSPTPSPTPYVFGALQRLPIMEIRDFLKHTGPADGTSYALLIIWSFIAGFAERLVPDTLNRLVTKNEAILGTNT
jgi:nitrate reductase NapE component